MRRLEEEIFLKRFPLDQDADFRAEMWSGFKRVPELHPPTRHR